MFLKVLIGNVCISTSKLKKSRELHNLKNPTLENNADSLYSLEHFVENKGGRKGVK